MIKIKQFVAVPIVSFLLAISVGGFIGGQMGMIFGALVYLSAVSTFSAVGVCALVIASTFSIPKTDETDKDKSA